jgi:hypothetical protein
MSGVRGQRWLSRQVRGARPDRNPLRRNIDRLETCLLAGLFAGVAAAAPFAVHAASQAAYRSALEARQAELGTRFEVRAVLTGSAGPTSGYLAADVPALGQWTSVSGVRRSGEIPVWPGSPAGTTVPVWTDASGYLASPPLGLPEAAGDADAAAACAVAGLVVSCGAGAVAIRRLLNRRRMAAWEADWLVTAPAWNRQRW